MDLKLFMAGVAAAAGVASAAQAAIVDLRFEDRAGSLPGFQTFGPNVYLADQIAFRGEADNRDYAFHFTYDTESAAPNRGLALVSGQLGAITDFSAFTPTLTFSPSNQLVISLSRLQTAGVSTYTTHVVFTMVDNDGDIPATLPTSIDIAALDQANAAFEIRRNGGVGLGYRNVYYAGFDGAVAARQQAGSPTQGGAVPEPGAWALMILGFGAAGATLRLRRAARLA